MKLIIYCFWIFYWVWVLRLRGWFGCEGWVFLLILKSYEYNLLYLYVRISYFGFLKELFFFFIDFACYRFIWAFFLGVYKVFFMYLELFGKYFGIESGFLFWLMLDLFGEFLELLMFYIFMSFFRWFWLVVNVGSGF